MNSLNNFQVVSRNKLFELFDFLNSENKPEAKVIAIREIDLSNIEKKRREAVSQGQERPTYTAFVAKAVAQVLKEMPTANRITQEMPFYKRIVQLSSADVSVAVERDDADGNAGGAFVYTVNDTDKKSLTEIGKEISGLAQSGLDDNDPRLERWARMKEGIKMAPFMWIVYLLVWLHKNIPSLYVKNRGGAALISSPSKYGVDFIATYWPYTIGVSFGFAKDRPWVENGCVVVKKTMYMTLSFDRRLIPGAVGARFLNRLCQILETE